MNEALRVLLRIVVEIFTIVFNKFAEERDETVGTFRRTRVKSRVASRVMPQQKPLTCIDAMRSERFIALALLSAAALTTSPGVVGSDSSSSGSSRSSSGSSSSGSSADWDDFMGASCWNSTVSQFGYLSMLPCTSRTRSTPATRRCAGRRLSSSCLSVTQYGHKSPPWQRNSSAPEVSCASQCATGGSGQLGTPRVRPSHWPHGHSLGSQPLAARPQS